MATLILIKSPGGATAPQSYPLEGREIFMIGRDSDKCQIVVPNSAVSREHAKLVRQNGKFVLHDMGSRNGTFVNQNKVNGTAALKHDDRVKICDFMFRFQDETARPEFDDDSDEVGSEAPDQTTVQHTVTRGAAQQFLEVQPSERLRALLEISTSLSRTLELEPLLPQIADTLFSVFRQADRCFIIMLDDSGRLVPKVVKTRRVGGEEAKFSNTIVRKCLDGNTSYLSEDASGDSALGASQSIAEFRIRSVMCVPMVSSEGKRFGALQLDTQDVAKKFKEEDLKLLTVVANLASIAVEKAQALVSLLSREKDRKEIEVARKVQLGFLPKSFPAILDYEFYAYYSPAQSVGGDYYDFISLPHGRVAVVLGDVAGKGVAAALLMAKLSAEVKFCFLTEPTPAKAVTLLNDQLIKGGIGDRFVSLAALIIDPVAHQVTLVNAGHINPMRYRNGELTEVITNKESGLALGWVQGYEFDSKVFPMEVGDSIFVFTDGVIDAEDPQGERFQFDGMHKTLKADSVLMETRPSKIGDRLVRAVNKHANGTPQSDDIAVVCFGRTEGGPPTGSNLAPRVVEPESGNIRETIPQG